MLLERGRDGGCWSWVVFECESLCLCCFWVISYEQTTQTVHSEYSQPLSDTCRAPCIASLQRWCARTEAEIEGTGSQSPRCASHSCDGKRALATHTEPSAKLITAHKAHHCDAVMAHAPKVPQTPRRPGIIDSRSTVYSRAKQAGSDSSTPCVLPFKAVPARPSTSTPCVLPDII